MKKSPNFLVHPNSGPSQPRPWHPDFSGVAPESPRTSHRGLPWSTHIMTSHGSLNVPIFHITQPLDSIRYMVYNGYYKVMSNIPKMRHLTTPASLRSTIDHSHCPVRNFSWSNHSSFHHGMAFAREMAKWLPSHDSFNSNFLR